MKAVVLTDYNQPFKIQDVRTPSPKDGEVLVRIEACGICGSDHFLQCGGFNSQLPIIPGHEASGVVVDMGKGVRAFKAGDRVAIYYIVSCNSCKYCQRGQTNLCKNLKRMGVDVSGALAEYVCVPEANLIPIPDRLTFQEAAVLTDAVATPYHALKISGIKPGQTVAILGVGGIGSNAIQLAKVMGAEIIAVSRSESKLQLAKKLGADHTLHSTASLPKDIRDLTDGYGADIVLQCSPTEEMDEIGFQCLSNRGVMVAIAANQKPFQLRSVDFIWGEKTVIGSRGFTKQDILECMHLHEEGRIDIKHLLQNTLPLREINRAMNDLSDPNVIRTVIYPNG